MKNGTNVPASVGGSKLIGINLQNDSIFTTIVFPPNVAFSDSVGFPIPTHEGLADSPTSTSTTSASISAQTSLPPAKA